MKEILNQIKSVSGKNEIYIVGGWLRDKILKRINKDLDIAVKGDASSLSRKAANMLKGHPVVLDDVHKIYRIVLKNEPELTCIDFAKLRGTDIKKDLLKRDFTINSLALKVEQDFKFDSSAIIDPAGGLNDLKKKIVRMTYQSAFRDDPLRLLRAFRIACELTFKIEKSTLNRIKKETSLLRRSAAERIRDEIFRILSQNNAASAISELEKTGLFELIFPEIEKMKKSAKSFYYHPKGLWQHSIETLLSLEYILSKINKFFPKDHKNIIKQMDEPLSSGVNRKSLLKFVALFHDIAKPECAKRIGGKMRFIGHEEKGMELITRILTRLHMSNREIKMAKNLILNHMRPIGLGQAKMFTKRAVFRLMRDTGTELPELLLLSLSDCYSYKRLKTKMTADLRKQENTINSLMTHYFSEKEKPVQQKLVDGNILMKRFNLPPGPIIGELLRIIQESQGMEKIKTPEQALNLGKLRLTQLKKKYKIV